MLDPNHQTWILEASSRKGVSAAHARLRCPSARSVEHADHTHELYAEITLIDGQGWSVEFSTRGIDLNPARSAAAAAYLAAWAFARVASVREDGNPYGLDIDTRQIPVGIVSFGDDDLELIDAYFGIPAEALREQPRKARP